MKRFSALLIGALLLFAAMASAYAGSGYNRMYWYGGRYMGNGIDRYGYGSYNMPMMRRYGGGAYDWRPAYSTGVPYYDGSVLRPQYYQYTRMPSYGMPSYGGMQDGWHQVPQWYPSWN